MSTISISTPSDGQTIDAADVNSPLNTIVAAINGNLDNDNIASGANISGTKLAAASVPLSALDSTARGGWISGVLAAPNTVTYNGNRNYSLVFNSTDYTDELSNGMRLRLTRTVTAPTQCTDLESGSSQYYSKTSPAGMTFTDDFVASAWVKIESYASNMGIISRWNGTSGWAFQINSVGQVDMFATNAGAGNAARVTSYQSVPLNKWVHVVAQLDMSSGTLDATNNFIMIDGKDVTASFTRSGTNPTALIQAGNLEVGSYNAGSFFDGKIAQAAVYSAKVTQATIAASISQTLSGSETSLISAYSFNNIITDLNTSNANNLTANGSAVATNVDSPFAGGANASAAYTAGTTEFAEVFNVAFSTNTTVTVQVPDGYAIPTSGGVSAVAYSTSERPLGWAPIGLVGYAEILNAFATTATTTTDISGLSSTVYVPAGRRVRVMFNSRSILTSAAGSTNLFIHIREGSTTLKTVLVSSTAANVRSTVTPVWIGSPTTGSHTYVISIEDGSAGTHTVDAATTYPAFISVELV